MGDVRERTVDVRLVAATNVPICTRATWAARPSAPISTTASAPSAWSSRRCAIAREDILPLVDPRCSSSIGRDRQVAITRRRRGVACSSTTWPGNIRELKNVIESSALMRRGAIRHASDLRFDRPPPTIVVPAHRIETFSPARGLRRRAGVGGQADDARCVARWTDGAKHSCRRLSLQLLLPLLALFPRPQEARRARARFSVTRRRAPPAPRSSASISGWRSSGREGGRVVGGCATSRNRRAAPSTGSSSTFRADVGMVTRCAARRHRASVSSRRRRRREARLTRSSRHELLASPSPFSTSTLSLDAQSRIEAHVGEEARRRRGCRSP